MEGIHERSRIQPNDCLAVWLMDLRRQAKQVRPYDADARESWVAACGDLLAQVPDEHQGVSWAYFLALDLNLVGCPMNFVMGLLLNRAQQVRR